MLEEHQWKTTSTLTKLGVLLGDLGGKVGQLSQAVEETKGRMDKTLEAVQVALREITNKRPNGNMAISGRREGNPGVPKDTHVEREFH